MPLRLCAAITLLFATAVARAEVNPLAEARERWLRGNYEEAKVAYEALAKDPKLGSAAVIGVSRALQSQGQYDAALAVVDAALKEKAQNADLLARRAEMLYLRGLWDEAFAAADEAIRVDKNNFPAHWVRAEIFRDRGDLAKAGAEYVWFVRAYNEAEIVDPERLLFVALASAEHARAHNLSDQFQDILNDLLGEAARRDKSFWPAEYEAGMLLLEKYNRGEALASLDKALTINPNAAEALAAKGVSALQRFEMKDAETYAERALKINPALPEGLRLRADVYLAGGEAVAARRELDAARRVNPRDERTLARLAACFLLQNKAGELESLEKEVAKFDPKPALFYFDLGEVLEGRRRYIDSEKYYLKATALRPQMPGPSNSLGMLYMRLGREKEAEPLLEAGFKADPFNVRVSNTRKVLSYVNKNLVALKTAHFELRYNPKTDSVLAHFMADYLEAIYTDLVAKFHYEPKKTILIELFDTHEMFSGRVVAVPDLHTIGACTGGMMAMASPHARGLNKPYNWIRVLRHELVHVFNLEQTQFLVPHWLTEGLAVSNEGFPRPPSWNVMLREKVPAGDLLNLDNIDLGFIRPRSPLEWQLAYCQGQLYVEYFKKRFGPGVIGDLLAAYRDGLETGAVVQKVCKIDKATLEKGYLEFLQETVKDLPGRPAEKKQTLKELKDAHEKNPADPDASAALAEALAGRDKVRARELAQAALDGKKNHPKASLVLARLERLGGNVKRERELLEGAAETGSDPKVLLALAKIDYDAGEFAKAAEVLEKGRAAEPTEPEWLQQLARVYAQTEDKDKQIAVLKELTPTDADDFTRRKRLTNLLAEKKDWPETEKYAREALEINVRDAEVQALLAKALRSQNKTAEAERLEALFAAKP